MRRSFIIILIGVLLVAGAIEIVPLAGLSHDEYASPLIEPLSDANPIEHTRTAEHTSLEGVLDPIVVERRGYSTSGVQYARTDASPNIDYSLPLDEDHGWVASMAESTVWNLEKIYAVNGTFDEGMPGTNVKPTGSASYHPQGWDANSSDTAQFDDDSQLAAYDSSGSKYVTVESRGGKVGQNDFGHSAGTRAVWFQSVQNTPYTEDFILSFDFFYLRGPIDGPDGYDDPEGNCSITLSIDGFPVWKMSLLLLSQRGIWLSTGDIPVHITGAPSSFAFEIGLVIDEYLELNHKTADYDGDINHLPDGIDNAAYITVFFDDISFLKATPPTAEEVDLELNIDGIPSPLTGSDGTYTASIENSSYWQANPVITSLTSNTSVSFNYETRLLSHRYVDSNTNTNPLETGVNYLVSSGGSPELSFYSYLGSLGAYQNFTLIARYPYDWENVTIREPQSGDVTSQCTISLGMVIIPTSLILDSLGWWYFAFHSSNYVNSLSLQVYDSGGDQWNTETVFRSGNYSRAAISIGSGANIPDPLNSVDTTWIMPNGTIWYEEFLSGGIEGQIYGYGITLGAANTTAGVWCVLVSWQNGTEIAYGEAVFEIHHSTLLYPARPVIVTDAGLTATVFVVYKDAENNDILMEDTASITANWSASTIVFQPNDNRNQWEADFNTALLDPGEYLVVVNASRPYYDDASSTFIIQAVGVDNDLIIWNPIIPMSLQDTYTAEVRFIDRYGAAITGASINLDIEPVSGLSWGHVVDLGNGNYTFDLTSTASGTYSLTVSASKSSYEAAEATFIVNVGVIDTSLETVGDSVGTIEFGYTYNLTIRYTNGTGFGLAGASVSVVSPPLGLTVADIQSLGDGFYSILLYPEESGTFSILIEVSLDNHETQYLQFTLVTTRISSQLTYTATGSTISIDQNCTVTLNFTSSMLGGIEGASLGTIGTYLGLVFTPIQEIGSGIYSVVITPSDIGTYYIAFYASASNHANATAFFPLTVVPVQTDIHASGGISSASVGYLEVYELLVFFERENPSANITGSTIEIFFDSLETLDWNVAPFGSGYLISLGASELGRWSITITANSTGYQPASMRFVLFVVELATELSSTSPLEALYYGRSYGFIYEYRLASNGTAITGATLVAIGSGSDWLLFTDLGDGRYRIELTPEEIGSFSIQISLREYGFQQRITELAFQVVEVPLHIEADSFIWNEGESLPVTITLLNDLDEYVSGAEVTYHLLYRDGEVSWGTMEMISPGVYSVLLNPEWHDDGGYEIRITVNLDNHELSASFIQPVIGIPSNVGIVMKFLQQYGVPAGAAIGLLVFSLIGYRSYDMKKRREYLEALAVKKRFDDIDNLIGIIILHGKSGLPIYSNVLKGGFEEGMISAFITAITHFRQEFVRDDEEDLTYEVIPISDIIRAVPTRNLVCAFITVSKASMQQEDRMVAFAKEIGALFDDVLEDRPREFRDETMALTIQLTFENTLDGFLLKYYKRATASKFPRKLAPLEHAMSDTDLFECASAHALASSMGEQGIDEARGCAIVLDAIRSEVVAPCDKHEIHMHRELDWQLFEGAGDM
ncbi:MAG: hypothetical protein EAX95_03870 [Candidatus Thorarchaeota archaeon]|nr:hypothetical protein [Candidatus Thorarchaeota archaeon]